MSVESPEPARSARSDGESFRSGLRAGVPYAIAGGVLALSFGVLARDVGFSAVGAIVMSAIVFAGSAQFAAVAIVAAGGGVGAAIGAAALMNSRFLPMGIALAPSLRGGPLLRAAQGQTVVDASWVMANEGEGHFDRHFLFGATAVQYATWLGGTAAGVLGGGVLGDPQALGLDAIFPAFFLALLLPELRDARSRGVALAGALIALALVPVAPPGVPVLAASAAALIGLKRGHARETAT
jgi:4-azaleucine resistance transporter AzlC